MITTKKFSKEDLEKYKKYLNEEGSKFKLTGDDLSNLFDLHFIICEECKETLKINKMDKWFKDFFHSIEYIVVPELNEK